MLILEKIEEEREASLTEWHDLDGQILPAAAPTADLFDRYRELPVHASLRQRILDEWPRLGRKGGAPLLRLLDFVLSGVSMRASGNLQHLALPVARARLIHFGRATGSNAINTQELVERFGDVAFPLRFMKGSQKARVCSRIERPTLLEWLATTVREDLEDSSPDLVGLVTGQALDRDGIEARLIEVANARGEGHTERIETIRRRLNEIPRETFERQVLPRLRNAVRVANSIENPDARAQAIAMLGRVREMPKPIYARVEHSARLFAIGPNLLGLPADVRDELTRGLVSGDLVSAQLVIASSIWNLPGLRNYTGAECWKGLLGSAGQPMTTANKRIAKGAVFGALYGSERAQIEYRVREAILGPKVERVARCPRWKEEAAQSAKSISLGDLVSLLVEGRKPIMDRLLAGEALADAFGRELRVQSTTEEGRKIGVRDRTKEANRIMASIAQSYEAAIMVDLIEHCHAEGIEVFAWLHDGLYFESLNESQAQGIKEALRRSSARLLNGTTLDIKIDGVVG